MLKHTCKFWFLLFVFGLIVTLGSSLLLPLTARTQPAQATNTMPKHSKKLHIVAFGDSLTAGYNLPQNSSFAAVLEQKLQNTGYSVRVTNAGVSGDTTTGGLNRLDWTLGAGADLVILELGANDALRGIDPELARSNLDAMLTKIREKNIAVLLTGMIAPPDMGEAYGKKFNAIYPELAAKHNVPLYPFFLKGVFSDAVDGARVKDMVQGDGLHPTKKGVHTIVENILPQVQTLLNDLLAQ